MEEQSIKVTDLDKRVQTLQERYPFNEQELEILETCHDHLKKGGGDDFLMKMAMSSPYTYYFLPGDELRNRVTWIEDHILPPGFVNELRAAISADAFVEYANQGEDKSLERFLEGVADTGRRGTREALRVLYNLLDEGEEPQPDELMDVCIRLAVASEAIATPNLDKIACLKKLEAFQPAVDAFADSLERALGGEPLTLRAFTDWAEETFPMLSTPLSTFVHRILFHGERYPEARVPFDFAKPENDSSIISDASSPLLLALSMTSEQFGGKWHRLYSSFVDGRSFNRMEWSILGYTGPTLLLVKTTAQTVLGAFAPLAWKEARDFYGNADCFLFELEPDINVYRPTGTPGQDNFMYLHSDFYNGGFLDPAAKARRRGLGFGGDMSKPRLFIPESFEGCSAGYLDKTFKPGELVPGECLEKFEIQYLEVWGVGGDAVITQGLRDRAQHRQRTDTALSRARSVKDKTAFAKDMKSGLIMNKLFAHDDQVRGRQDFRVDEKHGGYTLEHERKDSTSVPDAPDSPVAQRETVTPSMDSAQ